MSSGLKGPCWTDLDHIYQIDSSLFMFKMFPCHIVELVTELL